MEINNLIKILENALNNKDKPSETNNINKLNKNKERFLQEFKTKLKRYIDKDGITNYYTVIGLLETILDRY